MTSLRKLHSDVVSRIVDQINDLLNAAARLSEHDEIQPDETFPQDVRLSVELGSLVNKVHVAQSQIRDMPDTHHINENFELHLFGVRRLLELFADGSLTQDALAVALALSTQFPSPTINDSHQPLNPKDKDLKRRLRDAICDFFEAHPEAEGALDWSALAHHPWMEARIRSNFPNFKGEKTFKRAYDSLIDDAILAPPMHIRKNRRKRRV